MTQLPLWNHPAKQIAQNSQHRIDDTILQAGTTRWQKVC
jgi:hypothetical protein